ncbi:HAMP domain-containing protein [Shewanella maritima]|uniref:HAMP domain-containing protein n=1 Tax=Shewanella maritima TaxID=2520507 RepID=A0A411PGJ3_9GAMM|nr:methyl-accepting chemotaxis protein [Shewanella maritima]QBF82691.1 HAMP domain-containing protein [Shewanella maritima]
MFKSLSIKQKLFLLPMIIALALIGEATLVTYTLMQNESDTSIINIAGRQRMLTKKYSAEELFHAEYLDHKMPAPLAASHTVNLYETSLKALKYGGKTYSDLSMTKPIELPKVDYQPFLEQLKVVEGLWQEQLRVAQKLEHDFNLQTADEFLIANHKALGAMNKAVGLFAQHSRSKLDILIWESIILAVVISILCIGFALMIIRNITTTINLLVGISRKIGEGDLKQDPKLLDAINSNELGRLAQNIEIMRQSLQDTLGEIQLASSSINLSSTQVSDLSSQINAANHTERQRFEMIHSNSKSLDQSTIRLVEITSETLDMATQCNQLSTEASELVTKNIAMMKTTSDETEKATNFIQELSDTAEQVSGIVDSIRAISEQTNLLALNAAIEAARAGEQGRGFAVVADEVRGLAARTGDSTDEIAKLISQLTEGVKLVVNSMGEVSSRVEQSRNTSKQTAEGIIEVTERIQQVATAQQSIDEQVEQQKQQLDELKNTQIELEDIINESHKKSRTSTLVAKQLSKVCIDITEVIQKFSVDVTLNSTKKKDDCNRAHPRVKTGLHYELTQGDKHIQGLTDDISFGGTRLILPAGTHNLDENQTVTVDIDYLYQGNSKRMRIGGRIIHQHQPKTNKLLLHIDFDTPNASQTQALEEIYFEHQHSGEFKHG